MDQSESRTLMQKELLGLPDPGEGREYLVVVPHGWARDKDAATAFRRARSNGTRGKNLLAIVADVPDDAQVDQMGNVVWGDADQEIKEVGRFTFTRSA